MSKDRDFRLVLGAKAYPLVMDNYPVFLIIRIPDPDPDLNLIIRIQSGSRKIVSKVHFLAIFQIINPEILGLQTCFIPHFKA